MSGLLSGILTAIAIVGAVFTGGATLGILAGVMALSFASQQGWLGGSLQKFFSSGVGEGLTTAVGLAAGAVGAFSALSAANAASPAATAAANAGDTGAVTATAPAVGGDVANMGVGASGVPNSIAAADLTNDAAGTVSGFMAQNGSGLAQYASSLGSSSPEMQAASNLTSQQITATNSALDSAYVSSGSPGAIPGGSTMVPTDPQTVQAAQGNLGVQTGPAQTSANATANSVTPSDPLSGINPQAPTSGYTTQAPTGTEADAAPGGSSAPSSSPGFLAKAGNFLQTPGGMMMAGQTLSGLASGAAQQKMMQEQIAAQEWGNTQWEDPTQVANMQSAAAAPISVPAGYLNRAAAVRGMLNGQTSNTGPVSGVQPVGMPNSTPTPPGTAPTPSAAPAVAPLGMNQNNNGNPGGGSVPVYGMNLTPRGGML
jgi:hypothetical protein